MPRFALFSTSDMSSGRSAHLQRMIDSIESTRNDNPSLDIQLLLLLQKCPEDFDSSVFPHWITARRIGNQISLSAARNRLLKEAVDANRIDADSIFAFPDDDSWYPPGLLSLISDKFSTDSDLDFWFCRYSSTPEARGDLPAQAAVLQQVISRASSNTFFFRGQLIGGLDHFDENLGVGAKLNGGEDTEYAIRAYHLARKTLFTDLALVGHRDHDASLRPKYFPGTLHAIAQHKHRSSEGFMAYIRKLLVGTALVARGQMKASTFLFAIRNA